MKIYNCPNCGAGIEDERCKYCGTVIYDFAALQVGAPAYVKIRHENTLFMFRLVVDEFRMNLEPAYTQAEYASAAFGIPIQVLTGCDMRVSLEAHGLPLGRGSTAMMLCKEDPE